jgi:hypothetical protein
VFRPFLQIIIRLCVQVAVLNTTKVLCRFVDIRNLSFAYILLLLLLLASATHLRVLASSVLRFLDHTQWHNTVGRTPLDEWSARRRDVYLTTRTTLTSDSHALGGIRTRPCRRVAAGPRLRPLGRWDRHFSYIHIYIYIYIYTHTHTYIYISVYVRTVYKGTYSNFLCSVVEYNKLNSGKLIRMRLIPKL